MPLLCPKLISKILRGEGASEPLHIEGIAPAWENVLWDEIQEFENSYEIINHQDKQDFARFEKIQQLDEEIFPAFTQIKQAFTILAQNNITPTFENLPEKLTLFFEDILHSIPKALITTLTISTDISELPSHNIVSPCLSDLESLNNSPKHIEMKDSELYNNLIYSSVDDLTKAIIEFRESSQNSDMAASIVADEISSSLSHLKELVDAENEMKLDLDVRTSNISYALNSVEELKSIVSPAEKKNLDSPETLNHLKNTVSMVLEHQNQKINNEANETKNFATKCIFIKFNKLNEEDKFIAKDSLPKFFAKDFIIKQEIKKVTRMEHLIEDINTTKQAQEELKQLEIKKVNIAKKCEELLKEGHQLDLAHSCPSLFFKRQVSLPIAPTPQVPKPAILDRNFSK